ncbi:MAG: hypothetical protein AAFO75_11890 [Pseudomonadota bacterium]
MFHTTDAGRNSPAKNRVLDPNSRFSPARSRRGLRSRFGKSHQETNMTFKRGPLDGLGEKRRSASRKSVLYSLLVRAGSHNNHGKMLGARMTADALNKRNAINTRHLKIHNGKIWFFVPDQTPGNRAILSHQRLTPHRHELAFKQLPNNRVIVCSQNLDLRCAILLQDTDHSFYLFNQDVSDWNAPSFFVIITSVHKNRVEKRNE